MALHEQVEFGFKRKIFFQLAIDDKMSGKKAIWGDIVNSVRNKAARIFSYF